ncbi:hypothetical protein BD310DRAFT_289588 [Dichomitus squalens]|uniref:Uncharacterized protein n=1 Tax=Dichomitus squalens TaxID=114155 RepID=A0A4V2K9R0_9APHY|nr:hypothetical protein BD310DRAFT_289588 [Dichomitus squalens]
MNLCFLASRPSWHIIACIVTVRSASQRIVLHPCILRNLHYYHAGFDYMLLRISIHFENPLDIAYHNASQGTARWFARMPGKHTIAYPRVGYIIPA